MRLRLVHRGRHHVVVLRKRRVERVVYRETVLVLHIIVLRIVGKARDGWVEGEELRSKSPRSPTIEILLA